MEILPLFSQPVYVDVVNLDSDVLKMAEKTPMQDMLLDSAYKKNGLMSEDTQWLSNHLDVKDIVDTHMDIYVQDRKSVV